jgi:predicted metal-dependent phosphoesterase TrpH
MALRFDIHLHTSRYSGDSEIDPFKLVGQAADRGLHGVVITEHHHAWPQEELDELLAAADVPGFVLLVGFEYTSSHGDVLIYGLNQEQCEAFVPRKMSPGEAISLAKEWDAVCVAAHPTRDGLGYDDRIIDLPLAAMEVQSCNLNINEHRLGIKLASQLEMPCTASSDAHRLEDVGKYWTEFTVPVQTTKDFKSALKWGSFRPKTSSAS